jgi:hypothetical protein
MSELNYQELYEKLKKENEELKQQVGSNEKKQPDISPKELYERLKATGKFRR